MHDDKGETTRGEGRGRSTVRRSWNGRAMTFPTWPMENRFHGESLTRATRPVIVAGQPIRCLVVSRVCTSVLQTGIQPGKDCTLQAARHGHNGPSVPVTRTRHGDNPLDKRTYPARRTYRG